MNRILLVLPLAAACTQETTWTGTSVGNPSDLTVSPAPSEGVTHRSGSLAIAAVIATDCDGAETETAVGATVDLLAGEPLSLPEGTWCSIAVEPEGPLTLTGDADSGYAYALELDLGTVEASDLDGLLSYNDAFVLELGSPGWLDVAALGLDEGDVTIAPGDALHDDLAAAIEEGAELYADADGDGALSDAERDAGPARGEGDDHGGDGPGDGPGDGDSERHASGHGEEG